MNRVSVCVCDCDCDCEYLYSLVNARFRCYRVIGSLLPSCQINDAQKYTLRIQLKALVFYGWMRRCRCLNTEWIVSCSVMRRSVVISTQWQRLIKNCERDEIGEKLEIRCRDAAGFQRMSRYTATAAVVDVHLYVSSKGAKGTKTKEKKKKAAQTMGPATACRLILIQQSKYKLHTQECCATWNVYATASVRCIWKKALKFKSIL